MFEASYRGLREWEIRYNDRDYQAGDLILLRETKNTGAEMKEGKPLEYTGRKMLVRIIFILPGPAYGLRVGWVIMSVELLPLSMCEGG